MAPGAGEKRKSLVAVQVGGAQEDGDFVALRESREKRQPEEFNLPEEDLERGDILIIKSPSPDVTKEQPPVRPASARPRLRRRETVAGQINPNHWERLSDAACSSKDEFWTVLNELRHHGLTKPMLHDPKNGMNILHYVLEYSEDDVIDIVVEIADTELIQQQFEVTVSKITGKKNALHQLVERNDFVRLKTLLSKLSLKVRQNVLLQETRVEITGQRPRTFTCLHLAAFYGFTDIVVFLLELGVDVNHLNAKKDTSLLWAARWGHIDCVRTLLKRGALTGVENDKGSTAIYWAVRYGHLETVQVLAKEGKANVNQTRKLGLVAPIVLACALGLEEIVVVLLDFGADPNMLIRAGERPIHHAAKEGFSKIVELLLNRGARIDEADERGDTALLLAARHGMAKAMHILLNRGASVNTKNSMGEGVWEIAAANEVDLILKLLVLHQRKIAFDQGDDFDLGSPGVNSLIFLAASYGNLERLKLLFNMKIDPGVTDENGNNFLHYAALHNQAEVIKEYHKRVNIDKPNNMGNTALHEACTKGQHEAITELINIKAMANVRNKKGETALHVAAYSGLTHPSSVSQLMDYIIRTHPYECMNIKDDEGNNCLHIAAKHSKPEVLWEFRFVRFKDPDVDGNIPLHEAVREGEQECLETMLDIYDTMKRDCDINHQNYKLETPLILAAREGFADGVKRLLLFGADISKANTTGNTVLHELTRLVVENPVRRALYMELIDVILNHASVWYCAKHKITFHESDREQMSHLKRQGILSLVTDFPNNNSLSVLDYACKLGAAPVVRLLTNMKDVTVFQNGKYLRYDITHLTPRTNETLPNMTSRGGTVIPKASCLEWLMSMDNPQGAAGVLDIQPFSDIERAYSSVAAWTYAIIMIIHIAYMTVATWSGVHLLEKERQESNDDEKDRIEIVLYTVVPLEPAFIILYNVYRLLKMGCRGDFSVKAQQGISALLSEILPALLYLTYALLMLLWIILYAVDYNYKDYFLSIGLLIGWLISIAFTRGFKVIHYFWRMIQNMILRDIFKFMVIYLFVILAFSFAMHVAIQFSTYLTDKFPSPAYTMFMVFNLMVGMTDLFDGELEEGTGTSRSSLYLKIVYVIYIILATIVLLNLLIAMMNDSYQAIQQRQSLSWRIESVQLGVDVEKSMPGTFTAFSKVKIIKGFICPNDKIKGLFRWYIEVPATRERQVITAMEEEQQVLAEIQTHINNMETKLTDQIHSLKTNMDSMHAMLKNVEQALEKRK